jgi:uncharacterized protein YcbX
VSLTLAALHVYPAKSCRGVSPTRHAVDRLGLAFDRAFMVVDDAGRALTQRECPRLARIEVDLDVRPGAGRLVLAAPGCVPLSLPLEDRAGSRLPVAVWRHRGDGLDQGDAAARWLASFLERPCRLVRLPPDHARRVNPERHPDEAHTSFTDGYPFLVLSEASLDELNARLATPVGIERFRPNLVLRGAAPYAEDGWRRIRVGRLELALVKPCPRCIVTTVDPQRGERAGNEPLLTLARYRRGEEGPPFGVYAVARGEGELAVGMEVAVLEALG